MPDISELTDILDRFPQAYGDRGERLVGADHNNDSGYRHIVRFFGSAAVDPYLIKLEVTPGQYEIPDPLIRRYAAMVASDLRQQGRLYDGPTVTGLLDIAPNQMDPVLRIQETAYADFAGSCFILDRPCDLFSDCGGTLRHYYLAKYDALPVSARPLANCFGVCGYLVLLENSRTHLLQVTRARNLATLADTLGPTVAGSVDFRNDYSSLGDLACRHLSQEVEEELHLRPHEYSVRPLAFAREIVRGDNPQVFCQITCKLTVAELTECLNGIPVESREFSSFQFLALNEYGQLPRTTIESLNFEARMSYWLIEEQLARTP